MITRIQNFLKEHVAIAGMLAGWYEILARIISGLLIVPILVHYLGNTGSGLWFSLQSAFFLLLGLDFGFSRVLSRQFVHSLHGSGDSVTQNTDFYPTEPGWIGVQKIFVVGRSIFLWVSLFTFGIALLINAAMLCWGQLISTNPLSGSTAWLLISIDLVLTLLALPHKALLDAQVRIYLLRVVNGSYLLVRTLALMVAAILSGNIVVVAAAAALMSFLNYTLITFIVTRELRSKVQNAASFLSKELRRHIVKTSMALGINTSGVHFMSYIQPFIIGSILGPEVVVGFFVCQRTSLLFCQSMYNVIFPHIPLFTAEFVAGRNHEAATRFKKVILTFAVGLLATLSIFLLASKPIIGILAGKEAIPAYSVIFLIVLDGLVVNLTTGIGEFVIAAGRNPFTVSSLVWIFGGLTAIWGMTYTFGAIGAAGASLLVGVMSRHTYYVWQGAKLLAHLGKRQLPS